MTTLNQNLSWMPFAKAVTGEKHDPGTVLYQRTAELLSAQGRTSKQLRGCEDRTFSGVLGETLVAAVADGVSDERADRAIEGAEYACSYAAHYIAEKFDEIYKADAERYPELTFQLLKKAKEGLARETGRLMFGQERMGFMEPEGYLRFATTLIICAINRNRLLAFAVGNGGAFLHSGQKMSPIFHRELQTDHQTPFFFGDTMESCLLNARWRKAELDDQVKGIYLLTDGAEFRGGGYHGRTPEEKLLSLPFRLESQGSKLQELTAFLEELAHNDRNTAKDDVSCAVLYRESAERISAAPEEDLLHNNDPYIRSQEPVQKEKESGIKKAFRLMKTSAKPQQPEEPNIVELIAQWTRKSETCSWKGNYCFDEEDESTAMNFLVQVLLKTGRSNKLVVYSSHEDEREGLEERPQTTLNSGHSLVFQDLSSAIYGAEQCRKIYSTVFFFHGSREEFEQLKQSSIYTDPSMLFIVLTETGEKSRLPAHWEPIPMWDMVLRYLPRVTCYRDPDESGVFRCLERQGRSCAAADAMRSQLDQAVQLLDR